MPNYTPEQVEEFLQDFFGSAGTRQYIGARYVPIFGRQGETSIAWDNSAPYEPLTIVLYNNNSYTSRTYVPAGVDISNQTYWANTGNYNAQIEAYRQEVVRLEGEWPVWRSETEEDLEDWKTETVSDFETAIEDLPNIIPSSAFSKTNTVKDNLNRLRDSVRQGVMVVLGDSWSDESNDPSTTWLYEVANEMGMLAYVTNAKAGTGFYHGTNNIPAQVAGALTKVQTAGYTADDVTLVIAMGGVNDYRHGVTYNNVANGIRTAYSNARTTFPNAKILILAGNTGNWSTMDTLDTDDPDKKTSYADFPIWLNYLRTNLRNNMSQGDALCTDVAFWLNSYGPNSWANIWKDDTLHPIQTGVNIIAHHICNILRGTEDSNYIHINTTLNTPSSSNSITGIPLNYSWDMRNGHVCLAFNIMTEGAVDSLPNSLYWDMAKSLPVVCGGNSSLTKRVPVCAFNFGGGNESPILGYYDSSTNRLMLYPSSVNHTFNDVYGFVSYSLY